MHSNVSRRILTSAVVVAVLALPSYAQRRRAVTPPTATHELTSAEITGHLIDEVTNKPVASAKIKIGDRTTSTDNAGAFRVRNVTSYHGVIIVEASRTGYKTTTTNLSQGGTQVLTVKIAPTPTVHVRKVDNAEVDLDFESLEFGVPFSFSGYQKFEHEDFCKLDGSQVRIDRSQIKRIIGPAVRVGQASCCSARDVLKVNVELKTGEKTDLFFSDSCTPAPTIDLIGRNHVTGAFEYTPFGNIAEIVFP